MELSLVFFGTTDPRDRFYICRFCKVHLAREESILGYIQDNNDDDINQALFNEVRNVRIGETRRNQHNVANYDVADVDCHRCLNRVGTIYIDIPRDFSHPLRGRIGLHRERLRLWNGIQLEQVSPFNPNVHAQVPVFNLPPNPNPDPHPNLNLDPIRIFICRFCQAPIAPEEDWLYCMPDADGNVNQAIFGDLENVIVGINYDREHNHNYDIAKVHCGHCNYVLGFKYVVAPAGHDPLPDLLDNFSLNRERMLLLNGIKVEEIPHFPSGQNPDLSHPNPDPYPPNPIPNPDPNLNPDPVVDLDLDDPDPNLNPDPVPDLDLDYPNSNPKRGPYLHPNPIAKRRRFN